MKSEQPDTARGAADRALPLLRALHPRRPGFWLILALALYALLGFQLVPWLLERQLVALADQRLALDASVERIAVNPFTFTLRVDGFALRDRDDDPGRGSDPDPLLGFERLFVNFQTTSLFRWALTFAELHLDGLDAYVERFADGSTNLARLQERWEQSADADPEPEEPADEDAPERPVRLIIADLRLMNGALRFRDAVPETPFETRFGPLDFEIANLSTLPDASGEQAVVIRTEDGAQVLWNGDLELTPLRSQGRFAVTGAHLGLLHRYFRDSLAFDLEPGTLDLRFDYAIAFDDGDEPAVRIDDLTLELLDLVVHDPLPDRPVFALPRLAIGGGSLAWPEARATLGEVRISGARLEVHQDSQGVLNLVRLAPAGMMADANDAPAVPQAAAAPPVVLEGTDAPDPVVAGQTDTPDWRFDLGTLAFEEARVDWIDEVPGEPARLSVDQIALSITGLGNEPGRRADLVSRLRIAGAGMLGIEGDLALLPELDVRARMTLDDLALAPAQPYLTDVLRVVLEDGRLTLRGDLRITGDEPFGFTGTLTVADLALHDQARDEPLLAWEALELDEVRWSTAAGSLEIAELALQAPYARLAIAADGTTNVGDLLVDPDTGPDHASAAEAGAEAAPFRYAIGRVRITDGRADFSDAALPFPFVARIAGLEGTVSMLASDTREAARVALEGQVDEFGMVNIEGELRPAALEDYTHLDLTFRNLDMPAMSPYLIRFAGWEVDDGRLDVDLSYRIEERRLLGDNRVVMRQFELGDRVEHPDAMSLPLGLAVALLKDSNGVIDVEVPVRGDLGDPQFSYGGVIRRAIVNLITGIVSSPFRFLANLVGADAETFDEIRFRPGRPELLPPEREKLGKLAEALAQRPELEVAVPALLGTGADALALRTARVDAAIDARTGSADGAGATQPPAGAVQQQRRRVLEALAREAGIDDVLEELLAAAGQSDDGSAVEPDIGAYNAALRERLIDAQPLEDAELQELARERAERVVLALTGDGLVTTARVRQQPVQEVQADAEGNLAMKLDVAVAD